MIPTNRTRTVGPDFGCNLACGLGTVGINSPPSCHKLDLPPNSEHSEYFFQACIDETPRHEWILHVSPRVKKTNIQTKPKYGWTDNTEKTAYWWKGCKYELKSPPNFFKADTAVSHYWISFLYGLQRRKHILSALRSEESLLVSQYYNLFSWPLCLNVWSWDFTHPLFGKNREAEK